MILRLDPPIPVDASFGRDWQRQGSGFAHAWFDYGQDHDLLWLIAEQKSGEWWIVPNHLVRAVSNLTTGQKPCV